MSTKFYFLICILSRVAVTQITSETCRPSLLWNVDLSDDYILSWQPSANEECEIIFYMVQMRHNVNSTEYAFEVEDTSMDIGFLPACESMRFIIQPVSSDHVVGNGMTFHKILPLPIDANLTITSFNVTELDQEMLLEWDIDEKWIDCAKHYRLVIYNEDNDAPIDRYVQTNSASISSLAACGSYMFTVTPMYNVETPGPLHSVEYVAPPARMSSPTLQAINLGTTSVDLTWALDDLSQNRCPVSSILISSSNFNNTYPITNQNDRTITVTVTGLQPNSINVLNVTVENSAGLSDPVVIAVQTAEN
ncbi:hypothetical protein NQ317_012789 [Molorchus minor]|uniref:Fibronectin type-III domain-containing protein n=1 Tax=Molorchus minor TaxID=1323400 RepID=A0ABQ9K3Y7_9CUCU|nr:hypothetical protein NQ317_012789 [Molorchus minor]